MDGWETYRKIKGVSLLKSIPIAFQTAVTDREKIELSNEIGAADYITKPYDETDLLHRVDRILYEKVL